MDNRAPVVNKGLRGRARAKSLAFLFKNARQGSRSLGPASARKQGKLAP